MLCCCVRRSSSSRSSNARLKDAAMIVTCCVSFVAAFAVAMTTIAHAGAKNLVASVSILGAIILVPPILVSLCLSRFTTSHHDRLADEENAAAHEFLELEQLSWTEFREFAIEDVFSLQETGTTHGCLRVGDGMQEVLIRKLELNNVESSTSLNHEELKQEIVNLGSLRRCNVLPMLGFTLTQSHLLLFMPKLRSLTDILQSSILSWNCRCRVAALTARGLSRLHHSRTGITVVEAAAGAAVAEPGTVVHGNIRSENIHLLEDDDERSCTPYIVDTGLLKLSSMPIFRVAETSLTNSSSYAAPEYAAGGALTTKADVYSFGIVLLVLLSGRTDVAEFNPVTMLKNKLKRLMDPKLEKLYSRRQAQRIQQTALKCIQRDPMQRPDMIRVELMLRPLLLQT